MRTRACLDEHSSRNLFAPAAPVGFVGLAISLQALVGTVAREHERPFEDGSKPGMAVTHNRFANTAFCMDVGRLIFCRGNLRHARGSHPRKAKSQGMLVTVKAHDAEVAARIVEGSIGSSLKARLALIGPVSQASFGDSEVSANDEGLSGRGSIRLTRVALPQLGRWAQWSLRERPIQDCGECGVLWPMAIILANLLGRTPEFPRLRVLELGAGVGLAALVLASRGHEVVASDGLDCCLDNLRHNVRRSSPLVGSVITQRIRWDVPEDRDAAASLGAFDLVIGSDLVIDHGHCSALQGTLGRLLSGRATDALLVERNRAQHGSQCFDKMRVRGWAIEEIPINVPESLHAEIDGRRRPATLEQGKVTPLMVRVHPP